MNIHLEKIRNIRTHAIMAMVSWIYSKTKYPGNCKTRPIFVFIASFPYIWPLIVKWFTVLAILRFTTDTSIMVLRVADDIYCTSKIYAHGASLNNTSKYVARKKWFRLHGSWRCGGMIWNANTYFVFSEQSIYGGGVEEDLTYSQY